MTTAITGGRFDPFSEPRPRWLLRVSEGGVKSLYGQIVGKPKSRPETGLEEINSDLSEADFNPATVQLPKLETWTAPQSAYIEYFSYDLRFEYQASKVIPSVLHGCTQ